MKTKEVILLVKGMLLLYVTDCTNAGVVCCTPMAYLTFNFACSRTALYLGEYTESSYSIVNILKH